MRSTLTLLSLAIVLTMAAATWCSALEPVYNVGINETVETPASWIATAAELRYCGPFGFFSSTCGQKAIIFEGVDIVMMPDLVGYRNLKQVKLIARSTAGARREFCVGKEDMKNGIYVVTVSNLHPAEWIFAWEIKSKDKTRTFSVLFIRMSFNGKRTTGSSIHVTVQAAPSCLHQLSPQQAFGYTRGLIEAWATMDPAYAAKLQMQAPVVAPQSQPPTPKPRHKPKYEEPEEEPGNEICGEVLLTLTCDGRSDEFPVTINAVLEPGDCLIFRRNGKFVAEAEVMAVEHGKFLEARIVRGWGVRPNDKIFMKEAN